MQVKLCIFEDAKAVNFYPLTYFRPVFELWCGAFTLKQKIQAAYAYDLPLTVFCRDYLVEKVREHEERVNTLPEGPTLFVNSRLLVLADDTLPNLVNPDGDNLRFTINGELVAVRLQDPSIVKFRDGILDPTSVSRVIATEVTGEVKLLEYPWNLIQLNAWQLTKDLANLSVRGTPPEKVNEYRQRWVEIVNPQDVSIYAGAEIEPFVLLDARKGPIFVDEGAKILAHSRIEGPCFIGRKTVVMPGTRIYDGTTIGPTCKVGGELEACIFQGFSNKRHDGFLGHSYIGERCNLGAGTNNSDLKNNYSTVRMTINGKEIDTGLQFMGALIGDDVKIGINSMLSTGSVIGPVSNVFGSGFTPKVIPAFSWLELGKPLVPHEIEKATTTARTVMARRNLTMSEADVKLFEAVFAMTKEHRQPNRE